MEQEETLAKIKNFQKKQICFIALKVLCIAMPVAYTSDNLNGIERDLHLKERFQEVNDDILKAGNEIGKPTLEKYLKDKAWCESHKLTIEEQHEATKECFGEEWDMDKLIAFAEEHNL